VFIIKPDKIRINTSKAWQNEQEKNLEYIAITRARHELVYDYCWSDLDDERYEVDKIFRDHEMKKTKEVINSWK
jgi:hypothetical protein